MNDSIIFYCRQFYSFVSKGMCTEPKECKNLITSFSSPFILRHSFFFLCDAIKSNDRVTMCRVGKQLMKLCVRLHIIVLRDFMIVMGFSFYLSSFSYCMHTICCHIDWKLWEYTRVVVLFAIYLSKRHTFLVVVQSKNEKVSEVGINFDSVTHFVSFIKIKKFN